MLVTVLPLPNFLLNNLSLPIPPFPWAHIYCVLNVPRVCFLASFPKSYPKCIPPHMRRNSSEKRSPHPYLSIPVLQRSSSGAMPLQDLRLRTTLPLQASTYIMWLNHCHNGKTMSFPEKNLHTFSPRQSPTRLTSPLPILSMLQRIPVLCTFSFQPGPRSR